MFGAASAPPVVRKNAHNPQNAADAVDGEMQKWSDMRFYLTRKYSRAHMYLHIGERVSVVPFNGWGAMLGKSVAMTIAGRRWRQAVCAECARSRRRRRRRCSIIISNTVRGVDHTGNVPRVIVWWDNYCFRSGLALQFRRAFGLKSVAQTFLRTYEMESYYTIYRRVLRFDAGLVWSKNLCIILFRRTIVDQVFQQNDRLDVCKK